MNPVEETITIFVESPSGERFEADVPVDVKVGKLASDFFEAQGWPTNQRGRKQRAVVELVNPENPDETKRLSGETLISKAGITNGDTLRIFSESIAGGDPNLIYGSEEIITNVISNRFADIDFLEERVEELEFKLSKISEAFAFLGNYLQRVEFVSTRKRNQQNFQNTARARLEIDKEFHDFSKQDQAQLINEIARQTNTDSHEITLVDVSPGSVKLILEMPNDAAIDLMALYLNGDSFLNKYKVKSVELLPLLGQVESTKQLPAPPSNIIKILFLAANPIDTSQLRLGAEVRSIENALRSAEFREKFDIVQCWATRTIDIQSCLLRHKPNIVHFSGHGSRNGEIILEDETGRSSPVTTRALSNLFATLKDNIKCVVLNACYSENQAGAIANHIDCVVGMSHTIKDTTAISFATSFYQALGYGRDVETSFKLGCSQIDIEQLDEHDIPQLLALAIEPSLIKFAS